MEVNVKVITNAKEDSVKQEKKNAFTVHLNEKPILGKANKKLIELISRHFNVSKSSVKIIRGIKSRHKIIRITEQK
ncbi:MAG: DUF167 domain-containing protein [Candidatus Woesearchaeota archaeon]